MAEGIVAEPPKVGGPALAERKNSLGDPEDGCERSPQ
jgi:hypothetical protein